MIVHGDSRRLSGDGGSALVEAAFLSPVLLFVFLGILEGGLLMLGYASVSNAASGGARTAGIAGSDVGADFSIVNAVANESAAIKRANIQRLVIYKATDSNSVVPSVCLTGTTGTAGTCNVYFAADLDDALNSGTFLCGTVAKDKYWCPTTRKAALTNIDGNGPPDWIGVYIELKQPLVTKLFGASKTLTADVVTRIEPETLS